MQKCKQKNEHNGKIQECTGHIDQDGFCDVCGKTADQPEMNGSNEALNTISVLSKIQPVTTLSKSNSSNRLGEGIVQITPVEDVDPLSLIMESAEVPDGKRVCQNPECFDRNELAKNLAFILGLRKELVLANLPLIGKATPAFNLYKMLGNMKGSELSFEERERAENCFMLRKPHKLIKQEGFCGECGQRYSFIPSLKKGEVIAGQYKVEGPIAFGGVGWIYLARDIALDDKWVILKGLLNKKDEIAAKVVMQEKSILSKIEHSDVVRVLNFVTHKGNQPFIVMELVRGKSLKTIRKEGLLHPANALAFIISILPAIDHLHKLGLVYCDFKLDNVMVSGSQIKLIDLGGVIELNGDNQDIYGTAGYTAPEAGTTPSVSSDLYTIGRALAVLIMTFDYQGRYLHSIPTPDEEPLFEKYDSLYRFIMKATATEPEERFVDAMEMRDQALGVMRQVASQGTQQISEAYRSTVFSDAVLSLPDFSCDIRQLPVVKIDPDDPAAESVLASGYGNYSFNASDLEELIVKYPGSGEAYFRLAMGYIADQDYSRMDKVIRKVSVILPGDWRIDWYRGVSCLAQRKFDEAIASFIRVYERMPGELAPQLALALSYEGRDDVPKALRFYSVVASTHSKWDTSLFGLARCYELKNSFDQAEEIYLKVTRQSALFQKASIKYATNMVFRVDTDPDDYVEILGKAFSVIEPLRINNSEKLDLMIVFLKEALKRLEEGEAIASKHESVNDEPFTERGIRTALEECFRNRAKLEFDTAERVRFIELANQFRPFTFF